MLFKDNQKHFKSLHAQLFSQTQKQVVQKVENEMRMIHSQETVPKAELI